MVTLTLYAGNAPLATQIVSQLLASTCTAARVDFGGTSDAGSKGGSGGAGGAAGAGGQGGAAGGAGAGGRAGGVGTGGAGAGGAAGGAGAGGAAAGGASGGGTGAGGKGGGGAGGSSVCVPTGAENCFNGVDDDCDGHIDCDDSDCGPTIAECVAMDPTSAPIGMLSGVGAGACATTGYLNQTALMANLTVPSCAGDPTAGGCSCKPGAVSCATNLTGFMSAAECASTTSTGESAGSFKTGQDNNCSRDPLLEDLDRRRHLRPRHDPLHGHRGRLHGVGIPVDQGADVGDQRDLLLDEDGRGRVRERQGLRPGRPGEFSLPALRRVAHLRRGELAESVEHELQRLADVRPLHLRIADGGQLRQRRPHERQRLHLLGLRDLDRRRRAAVLPRRRHLRARGAVLGHADHGQLPAHERGHRHDHDDRPQDPLLSLRARRPDAGGLRCGRPRRARRRSPRTSPRTGWGGGAPRPARRGRSPRR